MAAVAKGPHILQKNPPAEFSGYVLERVLVVIVGLDFIIVMTFFHDSAGDCGFTTTIYKAATLIMGKNPV